MKLNALILHAYIVFSFWFRSINIMYCIAFIYHNELKLCIIFDESTHSIVENAYRKQTHTGTPLPVDSECIEHLIPGLYSRIQQHIHFVCTQHLLSLCLLCMSFFYWQARLLFIVGYKIRAARIIIFVGAYV